jgi:hypothetical protein
LPDNSSVHPVFHVS